MILLYIGCFMLAIGICGWLSVHIDEAHSWVKTEDGPNGEAGVYEWKCVKCGETFSTMTYPEDKYAGKCL